MTCTNNEKASAGSCYKEGKYEIINGDKVFIATNEWQIVPDDVSIPPGLWVRMDISLGGRLARLLEDDKEKIMRDEKTLVILENEENQNLNAEGQYRQQEKQSKYSKQPKQHEERKQRQSNPEREEKEQKKEGLQFTSIEDIVQSQAEKPNMKERVATVSSSASTASTSASRNIPDIKNIIDPFSTQAKDNNTDPFTVMERVLLKLPIVEMEKMKHDLIASQNSYISGDLSREDYFTILEYEWNARQQLIRQSYESIIQSTQVYKNHMEKMENFFKLPLSFPFLSFSDSISVDEKTYSDSSNSARSSSDNQKGKNLTLKSYLACLEDNIFILEDLEDFLTDVDSAYDFYAVGGWTYLINMLAYNREMLNTYERQISTASTITISSVNARNLLEKLLEVESLLILNVGHMIKHNADYQKYASESIPVFLSSQGSQKIGGKLENKNIITDDEDQNESENENENIDDENLLQTNAVFEVMFNLKHFLQNESFIRSCPAIIQTLLQRTVTTISFLLYGNQGMRDLVLNEMRAAKDLVSYLDNSISHSQYFSEKSKLKILTLFSDLIEEQINHRKLHVEKSAVKETKVIERRERDIFKTKELRDIYCMAQLHLLQDSIQDENAKDKGNEGQRKEIKNISKVLNTIEKSLKNIVTFYPDYCYNVDESRDPQSSNLKNTGPSQEIVKDVLMVTLPIYLKTIRTSNTQVIDYIEEIDSQLQEIQSQFHLKE